jgi:hypothetical protein
MKAYSESKNIGIDNLCKSFVILDLMCRLRLYPLMTIFGLIILLLRFKTVSSKFVRFFRDSISSLLIIKEVYMFGIS